MKKLFCLLVFSVGMFVAVDAQVDYDLSNNTNASATYTVFYTGGSVSVIIPANGNVSGTFIDAVALNIPWQITSAGCSASGTYTGTTGVLTNVLGGCLTAPTWTHQLTGGPTVFFLKGSLD